MSYSSSYSQTEPESGYVPLNNEQLLPVNILENETQGRARTRSVGVDSEVSSIDSISSFPGPSSYRGIPPNVYPPDGQQQQQLSPAPPFKNYSQQPTYHHPHVIPPQPLYHHQYISQQLHQHQQQQLQQQPLPPHLTRVNYSTGYGTQQFPVIMTDELVSGTRHNGRMSPVRRFYLLLCTFDLLFTCLLWIISILVTGKDLYSELDQQVVHYNISSSMFDCVAASASRFIFSGIFYGILSISHWWVITLTTTGTVSFLVAKVLKFEFNKYQPLTYNVMLVLLSFIISWGEVWFFDLRMIPLERKASEIWGDYQDKVEDNNEDPERRPLLPGTANGHRGMMERFLDGSTLYEGSVGNFHTPFDSPAASDDEDEEDVETGVRIPRSFKRRKDKQMTEQEKDYKKMGEELLETAWNTLNTGDWKLEKKLENGDMVQARKVNGKKVFKLTGYVEMSPRLLLEELFYKMENVPEWNPTLTESRVIQPIDEFTDISYQVCAEAGGGVVSTRDFVNLRHWAMLEGGVFVSAGASVTHHAMPPQNKKVRGENGPTCWALRPVPGQTNMCLFQWLLDTDLKGWIPQSIIDKALSGAQFDYIANIRARAKELSSAGQLHNTSIGSCEEL